MNDKVEIIRSNKGGMKIIHRGYMYTVHKKRQGGGIRWRCTQRSLHCKGSISTGNGPTKVNMPHNHIPDPHSVALARCRQLEEFSDITSLLETEYDDVKDFIPLQQRIQSPPQVQIPLVSPTTLQSQPLSPTKLKVTRQYGVKSRPFSPKPQESHMSVQQPEEVCLRWNSHHTNMQTAFPLLLKNEQYVDVTLAADGKTLKCHKVILSSCSLYFEEILSGITPLQHPVIFLKDVPFWVLKCLTDFMYVGEVNIDQNKLQQLLDVAEMLQIKGLAGKSSTSTASSNKNQTASAEVSRNLQTQATMSSQSLFLKNVSTLSTSFESSAISDPLELLEPSFQEDTESEPSISKIKDTRCLAKKPLVKKIKKRKYSEHEASPPPFNFRRGTRSRPNIKVPRYYHSEYEGSLKPSSNDVNSETVYGVNSIKTEPIDVEEIDINYEDMEDTCIDTDYDSVHNGVNISDSSNNARVVALENPIRRYYTRRSLERITNRSELRSLPQFTKNPNSRSMDDNTKMVVEDVTHKNVSHQPTLLKKKKPFTQGSVTIKPIQSVQKCGMSVTKTKVDNDSPIIIVTSNVDGTEGLAKKFKSTSLEKKPSGLIVVKNVSEKYDEADVSEITKDDEESTPKISFVCVENTNENKDIITDQKLLDTITVPDTTEMQSSTVIEVAADTYTAFEDNANTHIQNEGNTATETKKSYLPVVKETSEILSEAVELEETLQ